MSQTMAPDMQPKTRGRSPQPAADASTLVAFENAAAGHDGVKTDPSGELIYKPCEQAELDFYTETVAEHPEFAQLIPIFFGSLQLGVRAQETNSTGRAVASVLDQGAAAATIEFLKPQPKKVRLHSTEIMTETAIVLENLEAKFTKPNVMDIKLGAVLYDEYTAEPSKQVRLEKVARESTSGSLNLRVAGMKVWDYQPDKRRETNEEASKVTIPEIKRHISEKYEIFDKTYGRALKDNNVLDAFITFFANLNHGHYEHKRKLINEIIGEITRMIEVLEKDYSRMFSASVLLVYDGHHQARNASFAAYFDHAKSEQLPVSAMNKDAVSQLTDEASPNGKRTATFTADDEDENGEDEGMIEEYSRPFAVKMIDFAHARWKNCEGPDENVLVGLRNVRMLLQELIRRSKD